MPLPVLFSLEMWDPLRPKYTKMYKNQNVWRIPFFIVNGSAEEQLKRAKKEGRSLETNGVDIDQTLKESGAITLNEPVSTRQQCSAFFFFVLQSRKERTEGTKTWNTRDMRGVTTRDHVIIGGAQQSGMVIVSPVRPLQKTNAQQQNGTAAAQSR